MGIDDQWRSGRRVFIVNVISGDPLLGPGALKITTANNIENPCRQDPKHIYSKIICLNKNFNNVRFFIQCSC